MKRREREHESESEPKSYKHFLNGFTEVDDRHTYIHVTLAKYYTSLSVCNARPQMKKRSWFLCFGAEVAD